MAKGFYSWSQTASSNGSADDSVNYLEGQAPSSLNDSARAAMARLREWGNDISGAIVTSGTSAAYTVASNQVFDTLAHLNNQIVAFTPHTTNGAIVTLNVDGLGAKPLRTAPNTELLAGVLIQGTPYVAVYNNTDGAFYLRGFYGNPYNIPLGGGLDFWGSTAPNTSFAFPTGQAISRTTYASLFALIGTTYGTGDGSTTFNLPNKSGRVSAMIDATTTVINSATMSPDGTTMGAKGGAQVSTLTTTNLPPYTPSGSVSTITSGSTNGDTLTKTGSGTNTGFADGSDSYNRTTALAWNSVSTFTGTAQGGTSAAFTNMQPTILCNYILRII
jgi:microcystin-dependent protein